METPRNSDNYDISIHALRKESDLIVNPNGTIRCAFQSTLSIRRATCTTKSTKLDIVISIHALRKESDLPLRMPVRYSRFQSTLSVRRATSLSCA